VALVISCGGAAGKTVETGSVEQPKPRNAAAIAQSIVGGKVSLLIYAERTRGHPIMARLAALNLWTPLLEGTGIDPERDLVRAFITAPRVNAGTEAAAVLEHTLTPDRLEAGIQTLMTRSDPPGTPLDGIGVPAVRVTIRGQELAVARIDPSFLVVLPEAKARDAARFARTGGFPDPTGDEAAVAVALDPATTLKERHAPPVPPTVRSLQAAVTLLQDGSADIAIDGVSTSPEQASRDADELTSAVERATTLRIAVVKLRMFDPVTFSPEGDHVKALRHVPPEELDKLFGLLSAVLPR
jgi:hypothetical protein